MRVLALYNPISGAGRAKAAASEIVARLAEAGHDARGLETRVGRDDAWLDAALAGRDLLVVVGGDGAVRLASAAAARAGVALWQCPMGTENLFAREWGMAPGAEALANAIARDRRAPCDLGDAGGEPFALMVSVGLDADVVHDLAARRRGAISHLSYAAPILRGLLRHVPHRLRVVVDGRRLDGDEPGFVVVANTSQYALRLDPVRGADPGDGQLDVGWFPAGGLAGLAAWAFRFSRRSQHRHPRMAFARGREVFVESERPFRYQLDGDPPAGGTGAGAGTVGRLRIGVRPERLEVLVGERGTATGR